MAEAKKGKKKLNRNTYLAAGVVVGVLAYLWWRKRQQAAAAVDPSLANATVPGGGVSGAGNASTSVLPTAETLQQWMANVQSWAGSLGMDAAAVQNALQSYALGRCLSPAGFAIIDAAIGFFGMPPDAPTQGVVMCSPTADDPVIPPIVIPPTGGGGGGHPGRPGGQGRGGRGDGPPAPRPSRPIRLPRLPPLRVPRATPPHVIQEPGFSYSHGEQFIHLSGGGTVNQGVTNPNPTTYRVRPGDSVASIGARAGTPWQAIVKANGGIANGIKPGQKLTIPQTQGVQRPKATSGGGKSGGHRGGGGFPF